jgi:hypothetical protein
LGSQAGALKDLNAQTRPAFGVKEVDAMAILNESLDWSHYQRNPQIRDAFRGTPAKTLFHPGDHLCRFMTTETGKADHRDSGIFSSPWWSEWKTTAAMLSQWKSANVAPKDVVRGRLAVTSEFSAQLDSLVQIILTQPVYAWKGIARHQEDRKLLVTYMGGGEQLFLPNLVSDPRSLNCKVAYIRSYSGAVDMLI